MCSSFWHHPVQYKIELSSLLPSSLMLSKNPIFALGLNCFLDSFLTSHNFSFHFSICQDNLSPCFILLFNKNCFITNIYCSHSHLSSCFIVYCLLFIVFVFFFFLSFGFTMFSQCLFFATLRTMLASWLPLDHPTLWIFVAMSPACYPAYFFLNISSLLYFDYLISCAEGNYYHQLTFPVLSRDLRWSYHSLSNLYELMSIHLLNTIPLNAFLRSM